jgi:ribonucleotide monophosphatase NagD (HAD superfamily)
MLEGVMRRHGLAPQQVAVVGDRLYTDIAMGQAAGAVSVLVLTGETTRAQAEVATNPPDFVAESVAELGVMLAECGKA